MSFPIFFSNQNENEDSIMVFVKPLLYKIRGKNTGGYSQCIIGSTSVCGDTLTIQLMDKEQLIEERQDAVIILQRYTITPKFFRIKIFTKGEIYKVYKIVYDNKSMFFVPKKMKIKR